MVLIGNDSKFCVLRVELSAILSWGVSRSFYRTYINLGYVVVSLSREVGEVSASTPTSPTEEPPDGRS